MNWRRCTDCKPCLSGDDGYYEFSDDGKWMVEGSMLFLATGDAESPWEHVGDYESREAAKEAAEKKVTP